MSKSAGLLTLLITALLLSAGATLWGSWLTSGGLGSLLATPFLAAMIVPALAAGPAERTTRAKGVSRALVVSLASLIGTAAVWRVAFSGEDLTSAEWARCVAVAAAWLLAMAGVTTLLRSLRVAAPAATGFVFVVAILWLAWPVWLSHWMTDALAHRLTPAHPLMAINSAVKHLGVWDRASIAYRSLTVLNQDVSYRLPATVWPSLILQGAIGVISLACAAVLFPRNLGMRELEPSDATSPAAASVPSATAPPTTAPAASGPAGLSGPRT